MMDIRIVTYTKHFLNNLCKMYNLYQPDEEMLMLYAQCFHGVVISHLVTAFELAYEQFKDAGRYPSPTEILTLAADQKRAIGNQQSGPLEVHPSNQAMLAIFLKAFRQSGLNGQKLTDYLLQIVEDNYDKLTPNPPVIKCQTCKDKGFVMTWFFYYRGKTRDTHQKAADGKLREYKETYRVPNAPTWMQDEIPDCEVPEGQALTDGICRCECSAGDQFSFPRLVLEELPI